MAKRDRKPAASTTGPADDVTPADFAAPTPAAADPRDEEIARLREENARLKAAAPREYAGGRKYRVSLPDGPAAVVEPRPGEHPFEAFKRVTGVRSSQHEPAIEEAEADARCGVCGFDGAVPEPEAAR